MSEHDLSPARIAELLTTKRFGRSLELRALTASTNDDARRAADAGAVDGHVVLADAQTHGRGTGGRVWASPAGSDLYVSIVAHVPGVQQAFAPLTLAVGLGTADAVASELTKASSVLHAAVTVKWPNDVWVRRHKIAGILVESVQRGPSLLPVVIGVGLNVNRRVFPSDLAAPATSLALECGEPRDRAQVLATLLFHIERWFDHFFAEGPAPIVAALNTRLAMRGEHARCDQVEGVVQGVAASGALRMSVAGVEREFFSGALRSIEENA